MSQLREEKVSKFLEVTWAGSGSVQANPRLSYFKEHTVFPSSTFVSCLSEEEIYCPQSWQDTIHLRLVSMTGNFQSELIL